MIEPLVNRDYIFVPSDYMNFKGYLSFKSDLEYLFRRSEKTQYLSD